MRLPGSFGQPFSIPLMHSWSAEPKEPLMGDKSPKKNDAKKPSKSIKEKRADKHAKKGEKRGAMGG